MIILSSYAHVISNLYDFLQNTNEYIYMAAGNQTTDFPSYEKKIFRLKNISFHVPEKARFGLTWGWINFHFHFWVNWHFRWKWHASRKWAGILSNRCTMATKLNCTPLNRSRIIHSFILRYNLGESIYVDSPFQFEFCVLNL